MMAPWVVAQSRKPPDVATLRTRFVAALGKDFDLVKDEMKTRAVERGGGTFWLAFVKPKQTGNFSLQYRYRESPLEITEHEIGFNVGPEKCRRGTPQSGVYRRFCLGDTIIVPVLVNNYVGHEFKLTKAEYASEKNSKPASGRISTSLDPSPIDNPAARTLSYAGRGAHKLYHIIPGYTLSLFADFVATTPGRMNLLVTASGADQNLAGYEGVPVIVLPWGAPATLIAGHEEVRGYDTRSEPEFRSWSSNNFMTNVLILQPGDRFTVGYYSVVRNSDYVAGRFDFAAPDPSEKLKPLIKVRPFAPDIRYDFTEWIVDYLPRSQNR
jgi:hypothetical protein